MARPSASIFDMSTGLLITDNRLDLLLPLGPIMYEIIKAFAAKFQILFDSDVSC